MKFQIWIFTGLMGFALITSNVFATEKLERSGFWGGMDLGAGYVQRSFAEDSTNFFMGFKGGYTFTPYLLAGLELSGWLFEASDLHNLFKGEGISQVLYITRFYPAQDYGWFAKAGGGYVSHWKNRLGTTQREEGFGLTFGGGYDFSITRNWAITPIISYNFSNTDDLDYDILNFSIGFTFQ